MANMKLILGLLTALLNLSLGTLAAGIVAIPGRDVTATGKDLTSAVASFIVGVPAIAEKTSDSTSYIATMPFIPGIPANTEESSSTTDLPTFPFIAGAPVSLSDASSTTSTITSTASVTSVASTRPPESGFWSSTDPFPVIHTTYSSTDDASSGTTDSSTSTSSADSSESTTSSSTATSTTSTDSDDTTASALSTSISTHVTYVTASMPDSASQSSNTPQAPVSSSGAKSVIAVFGPWISFAVVMLAQKML